MWKQILSSSSLSILGISVLFQLSAVAQVKPLQNTWQQPYTPNRLQWLSVSLRGGARTDCGVYSRDGVPRAFYTWQIPSPKENRLVLLALTLSSNNDDATADRNFCMMTAFTSLRSEALRMELSPPQVEFRHSHSGKNSSTPFFKTYQCSVPAAVTEKEVGNFGRFENLCR